MFSSPEQLGGWCCSSFTPLTSQGTGHSEGTSSSLGYCLKILEAVQTPQIPNETHIFCQKYTPPMSSIFINSRTNYVPDQGYISEDHKVLAIIL